MSHRRRDVPGGLGLGLGFRVGRRRLSAGFLPTDLSNLEYWHDADDLPTFTLGASDVVLTHADKSGNGIDVVSTSGTRPMFVDDAGQGSVVYDGVNQHLEAQSISIPMVNATFFAVIKSSNIGLSADLLFAMRGVSALFDIRVNTNAYRTICSASAGSSLDVTISADGNRTALIINYSSGATGDIIDDEGTTTNDPDVGTIVTPATSLIYGAGSVSGANAWAGSSYEKGMYSTEHSAADRVALMDYLRGKWI